MAGNNADSIATNASSTTLTKYQAQAGESYAMWNGKNVTSSTCTLLGAYAKWKVAALAMSCLNLIGTLFTLAITTVALPGYLFTGTRGHVTTFYEVSKYFGGETVTALAHLCYFWSLKPN